MPSPQASIAALWAAPPPMAHIPHAVGHAADPRAQLPPTNLPLSVDHHLTAALEPFYGTGAAGGSPPPAGTDWSWEADAAEQLALAMGSHHLS